MLKFCMYHLETEPLPPLKFLEYVLISNCIYKPPLQNYPHVQDQKMSTLQYTLHSNQSTFLHTVYETMTV